MLNKADILLLKEAKENGLTLDQTIAEAEKIVARNELRDELQQILTQMGYIAQEYVGDNIETIEALDEANRLEHIIQQSYQTYLAHQQEEQKILLSNQENNENPSE